MATYREETYSCDDCGVRLFTCDNDLEIVTSKSELNMAWRRLHLTIIHRSGRHNDATVRPADLCKACAIRLLEDALQRAKNGERVTAGVHSSDRGGWE